MTIAGADGCPSGWICIEQDLSTGAIQAQVRATDDLLALASRLKVLAIDIPIGLPDKGSRDCDLAARKLLGRPRASSVFPAPIRPALASRTREQACVITARADGRRVGVQAWNIFPKIREIDGGLQRTPSLRARVREVHPEVSFRAWNDDCSMVSSKKKSAGRAERRRLVDCTFGERAFASVRELYLVKEVAHDDILDAFAALWTARRIVRGEATVLPASPPADATGLRIEIVY